jgi:hypothetical protein
VEEEEDHGDRGGLSVSVWVQIRFLLSVSVWVQERFLCLCLCLCPCLYT